MQAAMPVSLFCLLCLYKDNNLDVIVVLNSERHVIYIP